MVRIITTTLLLIVSLVSYSYSQRQILKKVTYTTYSDGTKTAKLHKFEEFFSHDQEQLRLFKKFDRSRSILKFINYSSIGMVGATGYAIYNSTQMQNDSSVPIEVVIFLTGVLSTGIIIGLNNAILIPIKNRRKDMLLNYNEKLTEIESQTTKLSIGIQQNGIGLALNF